MAVRWSGKDILSKITNAANIGVLRGTEQVLATAVKSIHNAPKTGHIYKRRGVVHQASAPGEAPATDTGRLAQSGRTEYDRKKILGRVIFSTNYARALEYGTQKIEPRPYARPALAVNKDFIQQAVKEEIIASLASFK